MVGREIRCGPIVCPRSNASAAIVVLTVAISFVGMEVIFLCAK